MLEMFEYTGEIHATLVKMYEHEKCAFTLDCTVDEDGYTSVSFRPGERMLSDQNQQLELIIELRDCLVDLVGESYRSQFGYKADGPVGDVFIRDFSENVAEFDSVNAAWCVIDKAKKLLDFYEVERAESEDA